MRWPSSLAWVFLLATGCAFEAGDPWGEVRPALTVRFAPSDGRLTDEGWLKTTSSYGVEIHTLRVTIDHLALEMAAGGADAAIFDPANPPPGYSLCHNGHCHADSGALVAYEDIAAEMGAEAPGGGLRVEVPGGDAVAPTEAGVAVPLGACPGDCALPRGRLAAVETRVAELFVQATIHDLLPPDQARLPPEGLAVEETLALAAEASVVVNVTFDKGKKVGAALDATLDIGEGLFDEIDWSDELVLNDLEERIGDKLVEGMTLTVEVSRYE